MAHTKDLTREEIKENRSAIMRSATSVNKIYVGDKRITGVRICGVCHRNLTSFVPDNCTTSVVCNHLSCRLSSIATVNICADIRSCYANIGAEEENNE